MRSWSISRPDSSGTSAASAVSWVTRGWLVMTILLSRGSGPDEDQGVIVVQIIGGSRQLGRDVVIGTMALENADGLRQQAPGHDVVGDVTARGFAQRRAPGAGPEVGGALHPPPRGPWDGADAALRPGGAGPPPGRTP